MRFKLTAPLLLLLLCFAYEKQSVNATVPITGNLYGEEIGLIHPNLNTSVNTFPACLDYPSEASTNPNCYDPNSIYGEKFICPTQQFYTDIEEPDYTGDPDSDFIAQIGTIEAGECDTNLQSCYMQGFMWSDRFGWITLDGNTLQNDLGAVNFPESYFARMDYESVESYGVAYSNGFAWSETGWIQLSACAGITTAANCEAIDMCNFDALNSRCSVDPDNFPVAQTAVEWGAFIDMNQPTDEELAACDAFDELSCNAAPCGWNTDAPDPANHFCEYQPIPRGREIEGNIWHEKLGWIKLGSEAGDSCEFGAWTTWMVDVEPPEIVAETMDPGGNHFWWKNASPTGHFTWPLFAADEESGIDLAASTASLNLDLNSASDFIGCNIGSPSLVSSSQNHYADLSIPLIGNLGNNPFCMYTLTGVIYDNHGSAFYFTDDPASLPPEVQADPSQYRSGIVFYIFAGDYNESQSQITEFNPGIKYANGVDKIELRITPRDIAGNSILPVMTQRQVNVIAGSVVAEPNPGLWRRNVQINMEFNDGNPTPYAFDSILPIQTPGNMPVRLDQTNPENAGTIYLANDMVSYPAGGPATLLNLAGTYPIAAVGYSPTVNCGEACLNEFTLHSVNLRVIDAEIPAVGQTPSTPAQANAYLMDQSSTLDFNPLPFNFNFDPPLNVISSSLSQETLSVGQAVTFDFILRNNSAIDLDHLMVDTMFDLNNQSGGGYGEEVLDIYNLNFLNSGGNPQDAQTGRTDPFSGITRYTLVTETAFDDASENPFHSTLTNYHSPSFDFYSDYGLTPSPLNADGAYLVEGPVYGEEEGSDFLLDRTDLLSSAGSYLLGNDAIEHSIEFLPIQNTGAAFENEVSFSSTQMLGYRLDEGLLPNASFTEFAIFEAGNQIEDAEVQNVGLGTSGIVSGSNIYKTFGSQNLITLEKNATRGLQRAIRNNVASLTRNMEPCAVTTLGSLSTTESDCITMNQNENTAVAYYQGEVGELLTLGGSGDMIIPEDFRYTIILEGGADLFVTSNIDYGENSSFGIIVLKDDTTGEGGDLFMSPNITNMAGLAYIEGSIKSSPNGTDEYYGNGLSPSNLRNQLYWREGAIASNNTLGGGPNGVTPKECGDGSDKIGCATRYDLNFIRRFVVESDGYTRGSVLFSGGGSCDDTIPLCTAGTLSSTITINGGLIDTQNSLSIAPFYIEQGNRPAPPGFTSGGGFQVTPNVIR